MKNDTLNRVVVWGATLIFVLLEIYSLTTNSHYKNDFFFLMGLLWVVYYYREKLDLHPLHFVLFAGFLVMHNLGTFGTYSLYFWGMEYDWFVHSLFGLSASLILFRGFGLNKGELKDKWYLVWMVLILTVGFSAFHELFEFAGALLLGEGEGVLYIGAGDIDQWDTHKDLFFNAVGAMFGLGLYGVKRLTGQFFHNKS